MRRGFWKKLGLRVKDCHYFVIPEQAKRASRILAIKKHSIPGQFQNDKPNKKAQTMKLTTKHFNLQDYQETYDKMREFTLARDENTPDEIWFLQHSPVFTQGKGGKAEHILKETNIPIIQTDRGGQITYHGPGQLVVYFLIDLKRRDMHLRDLIDLIEESVLTLLESYDISGELMHERPGVYVDEAKIASLGLHIRKGCSYHGLSLNVDMDLTPFSYINPCGYEDMQVTQLKNFGIQVSVEQVSKEMEVLFDEVLRVEA